jgi:hypothetical protein
MRVGILKWLGVALAAVVLGHGGTALASTAIEGTSFGSMVVDDVNQHVFVSSPAANVVQVYDFSGDLVKTIFQSDPYGMVINGSTLYVAERGAGAIDAIDLATLTVDGPVTTDLSQPRWLEFANGELWTTETEQGGQSDQLASVSLSGAVKVFPTTYPEADLAASPATPNVLYVAEDGVSPGVIYELDVSGTTPVVIAQTMSDDISDIDDLAVSPDGASVVPATGPGQAFQELSTTALSEDGTVYPGVAGPTSVAVSPAEGGVLATGISGDVNNNLSVYQFGDPTSSFHTGTNGGEPDELGVEVVPHGLALSADGSKLFAVAYRYEGSSTLVFSSFAVTGPTPSATSVSASASPVPVGQQVTLTANVSPAVRGGTVEFTSNGSDIPGCVAAPLSGQTATCQTSSLPTGSSPITASYSGDAVYRPSSGSTSVFVNSTATSLTVSPTSASLLADGVGTVTITGVVRDAHGDVVSGDPINFREDPGGLVSLVAGVPGPDGSYSVTYRSASGVTSPTTVTVTFVDSGTISSISDSTTLTLEPAPALTWAGAATGSNWSASANWAGNVAPVTTVGTLTFPALTSSACLGSSGPDACYDATNDILGLSTAGLKIANGYDISGQEIALRGGGLTVGVPSAAGDPPRLDVPLRLDAPQTWTIDEGPVALGSDVDGNQPLKVNFDSGSVEPAADMEVGDITGNYIGGFYLDGGASLNSADGNEVEVLNGAGIEADQAGNSVGPTTISEAGWLSVGGADAGAGTLAVMGDLTFQYMDGTPANNISAGQNLDVAVDGPGTDPGVDYSRLTATGNITLDHTILSVTQGIDAAGNCVDLHPGDDLTLLKTTAGTINGSFANYSDGASVDIVDDCNGADRDASGTLHYTSTAITLTITNGGDAADVPLELTSPSLSGAAQEGQTLQVTSGSWQGASSFAYSWWQCKLSVCSQIAGAGSSTFVPTSAQLGYEIEAAVTAIGSTGSDTGFTDTTAAVTSESVPVATNAPTVTGGNTIGDVLTASAGSWSNSPTGYSYQWWRCSTSGTNCQSLVGANIGSYTLNAADAGYTIEVQVKAENYGGWGSAAVSARTPEISSPPVTTTTTINTPPPISRPPTIYTPPTISRAPTTTIKHAPPILSVRPITVVPVAAIKSSIKLVLQPTGSAATTSQILKHGNYAFTFSAPTSGQLKVTWTGIIKHRTTTVARAGVVVSAARIAKFKVSLTKEGRIDLKRYPGLRIKVTAAFRTSRHSPISESATFELAQTDRSSKLRALVNVHGAQVVESKLGETSPGLVHGRRER